MGKPIVRVSDVEAITDALAEKLKELVPGYVFEKIPEKPNYASNIRLRMHSLHEAFTFILEAYPLDATYTHLLKSTLQTYANKAKENAEAVCATTDSLKILHKELTKYTDILINMIQVAWKWPEESKRDDAIACLNEAEQYVVMGKGRSSMGTLTPMSVGKETIYLLQRDEPLAAYYPEWIEELKTLKAKSFPMTPLWFYSLKPENQAYLSHITTAITPERLIIDLDAFIDNLTVIKARSSTWEFDLSRIHHQELPLPEWFNGLNKAQQEMLAVLASKPKEIESSIKAFKEFLEKKISDPTFQKNLDTISSMNLPRWYLFLSQLQQRFLKHALSGATKIEDSVFFLSSRHRTLPAPANFLRHDLWCLTATGEAERLSDWRHRSSHIASRDLTGALDFLKKYYSDTILKQVMKDADPSQRLLLQTLISPLDFSVLDFSDYLPAMVTSYLPELPPDAELNRQIITALARSTYSSRSHILNHPYNAAKFVCYTKEDDEHSLRLIKETKEYLAGMSDSPNKRSLTELINEYEGVLKSPFGTATVFDHAGRELFLSSLEQLIILSLNGYSYGSCVSGKDRKAVELMHTDAMLIYKKIHNKWPKFSDTKESRTYFVSIVTDLYLTRHQHELAGQNAPGAAGIKTPAWYLPADICTEIQNRGGAAILDNDDRLASDNEVKKIVKGGQSPNTILAALICHQLGEELCKRLYTCLWELRSQSKLFIASSAVKIAHYGMSFFRDAKSPPLSTGVTKIFDIIDGETGDTNVKRMAGIITIALERPLDDAGRTKGTIQLYNGLRGLCQVIEGGSLELYVEKIIADWKTLFSSSKATPDVKPPEMGASAVVCS